MARTVSTGFTYLIHRYRRTDLITLDAGREPSASCVAALRVKPKARLCEPWVIVRRIRRAAKRRQIVC